MIIYDIEIEKGILGKDEAPAEGIEYCEGWQDHQNMGISVIGCYDYIQDRYRVFCEDNFDEFQSLVNDRDVICGFNSIAFDNTVCKAHGITVPNDKSYDLLVEVWKAHGLGPMFEYPSHAGYGLDAISYANFKNNKTGHGAKAPVQWQRGEIGSVIDYCLADVWLTKKLIDKVRDIGKLISPIKQDYVDITKPLWG